MKTNREKMKCPKCGGDMNHHAEKVEFTAALKDPKTVDAALGGVLEEFHYCPNCGIGASRRAISS